MNQAHKWEIGVSAGSYYPSLTQQFSSYDIGLAYENEDMGMQFFAYSYHIDELDNPIDVGKRLYSLQLLLNGALYINWGNLDKSPIKFTYFINLDVRSQHDIWADSIEEYPFSDNPLINQLKNSLDGPNKSFASLLLHLSRQSKELRTVLFLCGLISINSPLENILTWSTLYKILDSIKHYSKKENLKIESFVNTNNLNKFTSACNNMSILWLNSRHGAKGNTPPTEVITDINEAINLILGMTKLFTRAFVSKKYAEFT